jgi:hypothetical protein
MAKRLIHKEEQENIILKVYKNNEWNEFITIVLVNGKQEMEYFTDYKDDAINTGLSVLSDLIYANNQNKISDL